MKKSLLYLFMLVCSVSLFYKLVVMTMMLNTLLIVS